MKKHYLNYILKTSMIYLLLYNITITFVYSNDYSNCNKLWGVTQDANGKMLYKVGMYMCVEDPYNIYKNSYSSMPPPLLNANSLPIALNKTNISIGGNITTISPNITKNNFNHSINYTKQTNISGILNNSHHSTTTAISPTITTTILAPTIVRIYNIRFAHKPITTLRFRTLLESNSQSHHGKTDQSVIAHQIILVFN